MRKGRLIAAGLLAVGVAAYVALLPSATRTLPALSRGSAPVRGAVHVHTRRSDGTGTVDEVAAAAARAGLAFVVLTDHGDGTRVPDRPSYVGNVLVIDAVEISTTAGHLLALGFDQAPYPLAGEPRDVVEDVHRLGGFAIAAHPHSPRQALRWGDWNADIDGIEWLNVDSEWRDESVLALARTLLTYPVRPVTSVSSLFERPVETLRRWDALTRDRFVVGLIAPDAHARIGLRSLGEPYDRTATLRLPSYETMFRTVSIALDGVTLTGNAAEDALGVLDGIRAGRFFSTVDAIATPAVLSLNATSGRYSARAGEMLPLDGPVTVRIETGAPAGARVTLFRDGVPVYAGGEASTEREQPAEPGVYRVEVSSPSAPGSPTVPWMVSNPIYVMNAAEVVHSAGRTRGEANTLRPLSGAGDAPSWRIERSEHSQAVLNVVRDTSGRQLLFRYAIGGRPSDSSYAAAAIPVSELSQWDRVVFTARAAQPMRLSVQLRAATDGRRWQRSVYLDETPRRVLVYFDEMTGAGKASSTMPPLDQIGWLLLVVDTLNSRLGTNGQVWIDDLNLGR